jgi:tyrosyl-tRNA synthetase
MIKSGLYRFLKSRDLIDATTSETLVETLDKPQHLYLGIDPTADSLHLGHLAGISVAKWFLDFGHKVTILIGGATARIGDPSGKSLERPLLDTSMIDENAKKLMDQVKSILGSSGNVNFVDNYSWFKNLDVLGFLRDVGKHFRLGVMLSKDSVKTRLYSEEGISFTEFSYQILQGYDFYHLFEKMGCTIQIGGSDQWGNITAGTDLIRKVLKKEAYGLTFPLLTRSDGKKFGKSEAGAIWLSKDKCSAYELYQYLVRVPDLDVINLLKKLSHISSDEIDLLQQGVEGKSEYEPNTAQKKLAEAIVLWIHGKNALDEALKLTEGFKPGQETEITFEMLEKLHVLEKGPSIKKEEAFQKKIVDLFFETGLAPSKSEATRLVKNGGLYLNNKKIEDPLSKLSEQDLVGGTYVLLAQGKKKKLIIKVN